MLVLAASVRRNGRSLAEIARAEIGPLAGGTASLAILFVVIIALSGLGVVVVKALGGEEIKLAAGTVLNFKGQEQWTSSEDRVALAIPAHSRIIYPNGSQVERSERFMINWPADAPPEVNEANATSNDESRNLKLPAGVTQTVPGSSWGTFTIACTI